MATIDWQIKGREFANCNCSYGCPCQFNALPTHGFCCAVAGFQIEQGRFGDVKLDGLRAAGLYRWPGPVHEGNGTMQLVVDKGADASQREALLKIIRAKQSSCQLSTYFVGRTAFYRLRQQIERELGDNFDLGRYHEAVLDHGTLPVKYLPELVRERLKKSR